MQFGGQRRINEGVKLRGGLIMNEEKQIEEKHELSVSIYMSGYGLLRKDSDDIAEQLYHEGYRKQSKGEWVFVNGDVGYDEYGCSVCGENVVFFDEENTYKYCPNCGAKMKGGAE
jgi:rubrerythrin